MGVVLLEYIAMRIAPLVVALVFSMACSKKSNNDGLPPASDWSGGNGNADPQAQPQNPHAQTPRNANDMDPDDVAAGMPPGHPDIGGSADMSGGTMPPGHPPIDQGGGGGGGPDVTKMGFNAPDPDRKVDPSHRITGTLKVNDKTKANVKDGGAVFLIAKKADANGQPSGPPLAVEKVMYTPGLKFSLSEANAMVAGTELSGDVIVTARYDQDSDAISKQPGDVTGTLKVKIPADNVELVLDTVLP